MSPEVGLHVAHLHAVLHAPPQHYTTTLPFCLLVCLLNVFVLAVHIASAATSVHISLTSFSRICQLVCACECMCLSVCLSACLSVGMSVCGHVCLSVCLSVCVRLLGSPEPDSLVKRAGYKHVLLCTHGHVTNCLCVPCTTQRAKMRVSVCVMGGVLLVTLLLC